MTDDETIAAAYERLKRALTSVDEAKAAWHLSPPVQQRKIRAARGELTKARKAVRKAEEAR